MEDDAHWTTWPLEEIRAGVLAWLAIEKAARSSAAAVALVGRLAGR